MAELLTIADVAAELGVSVSRARQVVDEPGFPAPVGVTRTGGRRVWQPELVEEFAASWQPRPVGRPRAEG
jgi:hypothetical protein